MSSDWKHIVDLKNRMKILEINAIADHNRIITLYENLETLRKNTIGEEEHDESNDTQLPHQNSHLNAVEEALL